MVAAFALIDFNMLAELVPTALDDAAQENQAQENNAAPGDSATIGQAGAQPAARAD